MSVSQTDCQTTGKILLFNNPPAASFSLWPDTFNQPKFF